MNTAIKLHIIFTIFGNLCANPPAEIPEELYKEFTLNGIISLQYRYFNNTINQPRIYTKENVNQLIQKVSKKEIFYYEETNKWIYEALDKYSIKNLTVAIMGSTKPYCEAICLYYQGIPVTIEYNKIISEDPRITCLTVDEFDTNPFHVDAAFSISSFEHDGLGRYGDPIDPFGDIKAMKKMKKIIKKDGILFLSIPVGKDTLVWNATRIYGRIRLPMILDDWIVIDSFGFTTNLFTKNGYIQPVFVLKNK